MAMMHKNQSVSTHQFAMVPRADVPRSSFKIEKAYKTTFDAGYLVPVYLDEILPGDSFNLKMTAFARLATPIFPVMDNMHLDSFFFFVPTRLLWTNWPKFMGESDPPKVPGARPTSWLGLPPEIQSPADGYDINSVFDYLGLPTKGQVKAGNTVWHSALPLRAYNLIWNEWFRDENLQEKVPFHTNDGPDVHTDYKLLKRGKRHDYFTSALPWPQKGEDVLMPLGQTAPVHGYGDPSKTVNLGTSGGTFGGNWQQQIGNDASYIMHNGTTSTGTIYFGKDTGLYADLTEATSATINTIREAFQIQRLLERDARGGTRYTELLKAHFGVSSPDSRLQRPEYLGGGSTPITMTPVPQTSGSAITGSNTPLGQLGGVGTVVSREHGFSQSFVEHGYVIGLVMVRADLTYQQGLRRLWFRKTRFDYYWPVFANLGEQEIYSKEIFCDGSQEDEEVFGYQERWAEYRYNPSQITGYFRSTVANPIDGWHLSQKFANRPHLNAAFIEENPPIDRVLAVHGEAMGKQFLLDCFFHSVAARPMPMYSVPGMIDHL